MINVPLKRCSKCGTEKPATAEFYPLSKTKPLGVEAMCRPCSGRGLRAKPDAKTIHSDGTKLCSKCMLRLPANREVFGAGKAGALASSCLKCERARRPATKRGIVPSGGTLWLDGTKWCSKCQTFKPANTTHFSKFKSSPSGLSYHCKACMQAARLKKVESFTGAIEAPGVTRTCTGCQRDFPWTLEHFYANKGVKTGMGSRCKECAQEDTRLYREKNPEKIIEARADYVRRTREVTNLLRRVKHASNREDYNLSQRQTRLSRVFAHKIYGLRRRVARDAPWSEVPLTYLELKGIYAEQGGRCKYCLRDLKYLMWEPDHVTPLSRVELNPTNGPENIVCACRTCNRNKSFKTLNEWFGRWYRLLPSSRPPRKKRSDWKGRPKRLTGSSPVSHSRF